jgi:hypothetical protein
VAPFYAMLLYQNLPAPNRLQTMTKLAALVAVVVAIVVGPFAFWNLSDFVKDVFAYPAGNVEINYPIRGYTIGVLLVGAGLIPSPLDPFPFWIMQLIVGFPLLARLLIYQWRDNTPGRMLMAAATFIFGLGLVSRFFQDNYVGFVAILVSMGLLLSAQDGDEAEPIPGP